MRKKRAVALVDIQLLGTFRLLYDGEAVTTLDSLRVQALLAYLLLHRGTPQSRPQIAFLFWPDSSDRQVRTNLRQVLHRLRRDLPEIDRFLVVAGTTLQWQTQVPFHLDVADFEDAPAEAKEAIQSGRPQAAITALEEAVASYQGELLPGCYDEWILPERERLRQQYVGAIGQLALLLENQQAYEQAIVYARQLLAQDDLQEKSYRQLMWLHALAGNRAAAIRVYHNCVTVLERELAVAPSPETRQMYEQLIDMTATPGLESAGLPAITTTAALVGRQKEWIDLQAAWQVAASQAHMVLLAGEAGIGKTRLAEHVLQWAARQGIVTAAARCYPGQGGLAYAPIAAWLRTDALRSSLAKLDEIWLSEIARILPELAVEQPELAPAALFSQSWQQQRFFDALVNAFI